ncbi:MAG: DUF554 domain-containing protein [Bacillota bacterium]
MIGTLVNSASIIAGGIIGLLLTRGIPQGMKSVIIQALALSVVLIGITKAITTNEILLVILSLVIGGALGESLRIEARLEALGRRLECLVGSKGGRVAEAFVSTSLIYCVGAMAIVGSIEDGLLGQPHTLFAKSILDGISAIIFSATMGVGVIFSAAAVLLYQGSISLLSSYVRPILTDTVITELNAVGGLLIFAIGLDLLEIKKLKVGNMLPSLLVIVVLVLVSSYVRSG